MSKPEIQVFQHHAMATRFQTRVAGQDQVYAAQAAQAAFALLENLESRLSRFQENSEINQIAALAPGEQLRLSEPVFACLQVARRMEAATRGAFSATAAATRSGAAPPRWSLLTGEFSICCEQGKLAMDLGAIGKGFALDRMAELLREWGCHSFLLVAGGSTVLAGAKPEAQPGWSCSLGKEGSSERLYLEDCSLSGSGLAVKGAHILDPRTGTPAQGRNRAWALADTGAESDALSTAAMVLSESEIAEVLVGNDRWMIFLEGINGWRPFGSRRLSEPEQPGKIDDAQ